MTQVIDAGKAYVAKSAVELCTEAAAAQVQSCCMTSEKVPGSIRAVSQTLQELEQHAHEPDEQEARYALA